MGYYQILTKPIIDLCQQDSIMTLVNRWKTFFFTMDNLHSVILQYCIIGYMWIFFYCIIGYMWNFSHQRVSYPCVKLLKRMCLLKIFCDFLLCTNIATSFPLLKIFKLDILCSYCIEVVLHNTLTQGSILYLNRQIGYSSLTSLPS